MVSCPLLYFISFFFYCHLFDDVQKPLSFHTSNLHKYVLFYRNRGKEPFTRSSSVSQSLVDPLLSSPKAHKGVEPKFVAQRRAGFVSARW